MDTKRQFALGIFFLTALSILAFYTLFLTDFTLFRDPIRETVYFPGAYGLREGDPVMVSGLRIGRVKMLEFQVDAPPERRIKATLHLNEEIELLDGARIRIQESTLLGGRQVDIYPGEYGGPPLVRSDGEALFGTIQENPIAALGSLGDLLADNRESVRNILDNLEEITSGVRGSAGPVGRLLTDEVMGDDLAVFTANLRRFSENLNAGEGLVATLLHDPELAEDVRGVAGGLRAVTDDLRAGRGTVGRLLSDEELAQEADAAIHSLSQVAGRLERGEGAFGRLLTDDELARELSSAIGSLSAVGEDLQVMVAAVREGEGSLGLLLTDEGLYDEALAAVRLVTRTLEDFRESAPVSTFTGAVFGAF